MFDWFKNLLTGSHQADFLEPETSTDTAPTFSADKQKAQWDSALGGGRNSTTTGRIETAVNRNGGNIAVAEKLADTRQQLEALADGVMPNAESKGVERTLAQGNAHIIRYGDTRLDQELAGWLRPGEAPRANIFPAFSNNETTITLVGVAHSDKEDAPMNVDIVSATNAYLERTPPEKRLVMVEGIQGEQIPIWKDLGDAIKTHKDAGAAGFIAQEADTPIVSPEAPRSEVIKALNEDGVPGDKIATFYILRDLPGLIDQDQISTDKLAPVLYEKSQAAGVDWVQQLSDEDFQRMQTDSAFAQTRMRSILEASLPKLNSAIRDTVTSWYTAQDAETRAKILDGTFSSDEVEQKVYRELLKLGETLAQDGDTEILHSGNDGVVPGLDRDTLTYLTKPGNDAPETDLREISRTDNEKRDEFLLKSIDDAVKNGKDPLIVFGGTHAIKIAPALTYMYA